MFFIISKLVWIVAAPLNLFFFCAGLGALLLNFSKFFSRLFLIAATIIFLICGVSPLGPYMLHKLEHSVERPASLPDKIDGILVLGGAFETSFYQSAEPYEIPLTYAAERVFTALSIYKDYPDSQFVFSGGNGKLIGGQVEEAVLAKEMVERMGYSVDEMRFEDRSRNTYENFRSSFEMIQPGANERWIVVTSAYHMLRSLGVAKATGWQNVIAYPVDYQAKPLKISDVFIVDILGNFYAMNIFARECLGIIAYKLTGKMAFPAQER